MRIKPRKRLAVRFPLSEYRVPTKPSLRPFENQKLKQSHVVVNGDAPLAIVVLDQPVVGRPFAPMNHCVPHFIISLKADHNLRFVRAR